MRDLCAQLAVMEYYERIGEYTDAPLPEVEYITDETPDDMQDEDDLVAESAVPIRYFDDSVLNIPVRDGGVDRSIAWQDLFLLQYGPVAIHQFLKHAPDAPTDLDLHDMNDDHLPDVMDMLSGIFDEWARNTRLQEVI